MFANPQDHDFDSHRNAAFDSLAEFVRKDIYDGTGWAFAEHQQMDMHERHEIFAMYPTLGRIPYPPCDLSRPLLESVFYLLNYYNDPFNQLRSQRSKDKRRRAEKSSRSRDSDDRQALVSSKHRDRSLMPRDLTAMVRYGAHPYSKSRSTRLLPAPEL